MPKAKQRTGVPNAASALGWWTVALILIVALIGLFALLFATRPGPGITPDSTVYLAAAQSLLRGVGLRVLSDGSGELIPLTHYPPLYPALLALLGKSGAALPDAARWLNAFLFSVNIALVGLCISCFARASFWLPVLGSALTLSAVDLAAAHSFALTEPLFVCCVLMGLLSLAFYLEKQEFRFLILAAVALALSVLTRYVGVVAVATGGLALLLFSAVDPASPRRGLRRRVLDASLFGAIACLPPALWAIRNRLETGGATERQFVFHPVKFSQIVAGVSTVAQWLLLGRFSANFRALALLIEAALLVGISLYLWRQARNYHAVIDKGPAPRLPQVLGLFIAVYVAFLVFTASFVDADTVFDNRSLLPVHVAGIILVLCLVWRLYLRSSASHSARTILVVLAVLLTVSQSLRFAGWLKHTNNDGQGYASRAWIRSETIAAVKEMPAQTAIYSNGQDAIYYLSGRPAMSIPERVLHGTGRVNQNFDNELAQLAHDLEEHKAVLVYFHTLPERTYLPTEDELKRRLPFPLAGYADGVVFSRQR